MVSGLSALGFAPNAPATGQPICKPVTPRPFNGTLHPLCFQYISLPLFPSWLNGNPLIRFAFIRLRALSSPTGGYTPTQGPPWRKGSIVYQPPAPARRATPFRPPRSSSPAKGFEQGFFLFLGELRERVEGGEVAAQRGGGEACKHFGGEPMVAGPASGEQDERADAAQNNLHAESNQHGHAGLALATHLAEFEFSRKAQRRPIGDGK